MTDFINKIITLALILILVIVAPLNLSYQSERNLSMMNILNEITLFLDKTTDKRSINQSDLDDFYLAINSYGMMMDADIVIYAPVAEATTSYYIAAYNLNDINDPVTKDLVEKPLEDIKPGYKLQVRVYEVSISPARRMMYNTMGYDPGGYEQTMAAYIGR